MPNPLREYQQEAVNQGYAVLKAYGGFYIMHDPGMGKTLDAIVLARLLKVKRICVACPVAAVGVWCREFDKWWPQWSAEGVAQWIITWDKLVSEQKQVSEFEPELFIMDEAHYAKSPSALRTKAAMQVRRWSTYCLALSGTPVHSELDYWAQFQMIAPKEPLFNQTFSSYRDKLFVLSRPGGGNVAFPKKDKNGGMMMKPGMREQLTQTLDPYIHVATADQMNVPAPVITEIPVTLSDAEETAYGEMETYLRTQLPSGEDTEAEIVLTKMLRLSQIAAGHATSISGNPERIGYSKLSTLDDLLIERAEHKVIVACRFKADIQSIRDHLNAQGRPLAIIDGTTPAQYRTQYEEWFQSGKHSNGVLLLQYQAGGVALTLTAAKALVLYTLDHSVIHYRQMLGRVWRDGQTRAVEVLPLLADGTQDWVLWAGLTAGVNNTNMARMLKEYLHR